MYTQSPIQVKRQVPVQVYNGQQTFDLGLIVVAGSGPILLGRNWLHSIRLDWTRHRLLFLPHCHLSGSASSPLQG